MLPIHSVYLDLLRYLTTPTLILFKKLRHNSRWRYRSIWLYIVVICSYEPAEEQNSSYLCELCNVLRYHIYMYNVTMILARANGLVFCIILQQLGS